MKTKPLMDAPFTSTSITSTCYQIILNSLNVTFLSFFGPNVVNLFNRNIKKELLLVFAILAIDIHCIC